MNREEAADRRVVDALRTIKFWHANRTARMRGV